MLYKLAATLYRAVKKGDNPVKVFDPKTIKDRNLKVKGLYLAPSRETAERWGATLFQKEPYEIHKFHVPDDVHAVGVRDGFYVHPDFKDMMKIKADKLGNLLKDKQLATGIKRITGRLYGFDGPKVPMETESLPEIVIGEKFLKYVKHLGKV